MSKWKNHVKRWEACDLCPLCETRLKTVLGRGKLPCDVLFIGEAPGPNENVIGQPFVGPAGQLLNSMVAEAGGDEHRLFFTNLVACIPKGDDGAKFTEPPKESIQKCAHRVAEVIRIAKPKLIITVGKLSDKWVPKVADNLPPLVSIIHPAAILRAEQAQKGFAIQRTVVLLADAFSDLS